jgi:DNA-binding PadR family transcriptional regulator
MLSVLLDGSATGYELAKRFDASVAHVWHALPQQLYQELGRMEDEGLVEGEVVVQTTRPNKRVFSITKAGRDALEAWLSEPYRMRGMKEELLIKMYSADIVEPEQIIGLLEGYIAMHEEKLALYERFREQMFRGRSEDDFVATTHRVGPYLALVRGLTYERENIGWAKWVIGVMRRRLELPRRARAGAARPH